MSIIKITQEQYLKLMDTPSTLSPTAKETILAKLLTGVNVLEFQSKSELEKIWAETFLNVDTAELFLKSLVPEKSSE